MISCPKCGKTPVQTSTTLCEDCRRKPSSPNDLEQKAKEWWALVTPRNTTVRLEQNESIFDLIDMHSFTNWLLCQAITELTNLFKKIVEE